MNVLYGICIIGISLHDDSFDFRETPQESARRELAAYFLSLGVLTALFVAHHTFVLVLGAYLKYKAKRIRTSATSFLLRLIQPCGGMWAVTMFVITGLSTGGVLADAHPIQANLFILCDDPVCYH